MRRDELLATFWPDLDTGHARASLRRALYFLRQELGEGVVVGRGEELGVLPAALWCDVTAFREAIAAREWARALELYRGDLLQGMFIAGADEAERWLERERGALRAAAGEAAGVLATSAGGWEAVEWSRRALALSPCEDASVQRLMRQLADLGDRAGALRGYQEFAQRLRADLDLEPDGATAGLASKIRAMEAAPPAHRAAATEQSVATVPHLVFVGPIHFRGTDRYAYLGPALTELLASTIHGAGPYRTVDPSIVIANPAGSDLPAAVARAIRRRPSGERDHHRSRRTTPGGHHAHRDRSRVELRGWRRMPRRSRACSSWPTGFPAGSSRRWGFQSGFRSTPRESG